MSKSKVITLTIIGVLLAMSVLIGVSYSLWRISLVQETANTLTTSCFDVTFTEDNNISLQNAYPLYDEDGKKLTPYTFTIQNNCEAYATYNIQLEVLSSSSLASEHLKIQINEEEPVILNTLETGEVTLSEADEAYILDTGTLNLSEGKTYTLRVWLDSSVTLETEGVQNATWSAKVTVNSSYTDEVPSYCEMNPETGACTILAKGETDELKFDNTEDNNLRYIGANPNNYVTFNNELWRIIGVFNNIDDGTGTKETRLKIIRNESIGNYSWDNKPSGIGSSTSTNGSNDWSDSRLMMMLNPGYETPNSPIYEYEGSLYYNAKSGTCYSRDDGATVSCDFTDTGLQSTEAKEMIGNAVWDLGGTSGSSNTASAFYAYERGTTVYEGRPTEWTGKIGLMYASDYGYATSGGNTTNREMCLNTALYDWDSSSVSDCKNNDWLCDSLNACWTLTSNSSFSNNVFYVFSYLGVRYSPAYGSSAVSPALYLNSNVKISGGSGTEESPYTLSL